MPSGTASTWTAELAARVWGSRSRGAERWKKAVESEAYGGQSSQAAANPATATAVGAPRPAGSMQTPKATTMPVTAGPIGSRPRYPVSTEPRTAPTPNAV